MRMSSAPKVQTRAVPEGRSKWNERNKPSDSTQKREHPADEQPAAEAAGEMDAADGGDDAIGEDEQHAGDADETGDDESERSVEKKIPEPNAQTLLKSGFAVEGDEQELFAKGEMKDADEREKAEAFPNLRRSHEQDVADEHVFDFLIALGRAAEQEHSGRGGDDVGDADHRLLRHLALAFAGEGKNRRADEGEAERDPEGCGAFQVQPQQHRDADAERGHLRHRDVDEDDAALHDMNAEIDEQPGLDDAGHAGPEHDFPHG